MGLPIVGYIPFLPQDPSLQLRQLRQKYGSMFSLRIGPSNVVFIADVAIIKHVMKQDAFNYKPTFDFFSSFLPTILNSWSGPLHQEHRRFCLRTQKGLSSGSTAMEQCILEGIRSISADIRRESGKPVDSHRLMSYLVANVVNQLIMGEAMDESHPLGRCISDSVMDEGGFRPSLFGYANYMPLLSYLMRLLPRQGTVGLLRGGLVEWSSGTTLSWWHHVASGAIW